MRKGPAHRRALSRFPSTGMRAWSIAASKDFVPPACRANEFAATTTQSPPAWTRRPGGMRRSRHLRVRTRKLHRNPTTYSGLAGVTGSRAGSASNTWQSPSCTTIADSTRRCHAGGLRVFVAANSFALPRPCPAASRTTANPDFPPRLPRSGRAPLSRFGLTQPRARARFARVGTGRARARRGDTRAGRIRAFVARSSFDLPAPGASG
jgi:hypothetical protein